LQSTVLKFPKKTRILNIDIRIWLWVVIGLFAFFATKVLFFSQQHFEEVLPTVFLDPVKLRLAKDCECLCDEDHENILMTMRSSGISVTPPATYNLWAQSPNANSKLSTFVLNQGPLGSCTANAMSYAWMLFKYKSWSNGQVPPPPPSRLYWYAEARMHLNALDGYPNAPLNDTGCYVSDIAWVPSAKGMLPETAYPYTYTVDRFRNVVPTSGLVNKFPTPAHVTAAALNKINEGLITEFRYSANRNTTLLNMKLALSQNKSILIGVLVYSSFQSASALRTGNIPIPNPWIETLLGGHCICLTGYDSTCFTFRNSWGTSVGVRGAFRIPFTYITNPNLSGDAWIF
jgi:hypothetical protein